MLNTGVQTGVNIIASHSRNMPAIAYLDDGSYVIISLGGHDGASEDTYSQHYNAQGVAIGEEIVVDSKPFQASKTLAAHPMMINWLVTTATIS